MSERKSVSLFRNGRNQAIRIPVEFELPGKEATIRKEGNLLIIEANEPKGDWLEWLRQQEPLGPDDQFPDIDVEELPPQRNVEL